MAVFTFRALDSQGQEVRDEIEANNADDALNKLRGKNLFPTSVKEKSGRRAAAPRAAAAVGGRKRALAFGKVRTKYLATFTRQLSTLINAGLPIVRSLRILGEQLKASVLKNCVLDAADDVEGGSSFSEALGKHPRAFNKLYVNMAKAGEAGGILDQILERLAVFMEKAERLKKRVLGAMIYPAAVMTIAGIILFVILAYIVPRFQDVFADLGVELPVATKLLIVLGTALRTYWYLVVASPIVLFVAFRVVVASKSGRYGVDFVKLHLPIFGAIISKSSIARFARTLGTLIASGVPILEALNIVKEATPNTVVSDAVGKVHDSIREGETMAAPLAASKVCDAMVVNMIDVGEETGELDKMLLKVADTYDEDVDTLVGSLMSLIEPLLIVGMGVTVGFIVIALFLPLIEMMKNLGKA